LPSYVKMFSWSLCFEYTLLSALSTENPHADKCTRELL
jgi:hypothetical protein